jgi:hypothetical protein
MLIAQASGVAFDTLACESDRSFPGLILKTAAELKRALKELQVLLPKPQPIPPNFPPLEVYLLESPK